MFMSSCLEAQSVTEKLGAVSTEFTFLSLDDTLNVTDQIILKRGLSKAKTENDRWGDSAYGMGYGLGLETFRLEFSSKDNIKTLLVSERNKRAYEIEFLDQNQSLLLKKEVSIKNMIRYWNGEDLHVFSLNLQDIPLVILNTTSYFKITYLASE